MGNKTLKRIVCMLLLITLTSANFIFLGVTSVTYAASQLSLEGETNHKNISFMAYFKEGEEEVTEYPVKANVSEEKIYLKLSVSKEGYFNGKITLSDSNFKFKTDTKHERIQSITENEIKLNQIVSGETVEIPVGISIIKDTNLSVSLLTAQSKLKLEGMYTYGSKPDKKEIKGEREVELKITSPYEQGNEGIFINQTVLTNKVFQLAEVDSTRGITPSDIEIPKGTTPSDIEIPKGTTPSDIEMPNGIISNDIEMQKGITPSDIEIPKGITPSDIDVPNSTNKIDNRIIQLQVETGMEGNLYPIKTEKLELQAPKLKSQYPESVLVQTPNALAMNGEKIQDEEYEYNAETGVLNIEVNNEEKDGKIVWNKEGTDKYIVTYVFEGTEDIEKQDLVAKAQISLYDPNKTVATYSKKTTLSPEEIDSSITVSLNNTENEIYKGAIYEGIEREIAQNININVNLIGNMDTIKVQENLTNTHMANIRTKAVVVNKSNLKEILGEEGKITIKNKATGEVVGTITGKEETEEITVQLPAEVGEILIETTKPEKAGILKIKSVKVIPAQDRQAMQGVTDMTFGASISYILGEAESKPVEATSNIILKETQTYATLKVNRTEFSTMRTNENVEIEVTLHSNNEKYELYKNPKIRLALPEEFEGINITSVNLLNEDELKITNQITDGNVLELELTGEQKSYKGQSIEGATILITADLTANRKQKNVDTKFVLEYENEKAIHYVEGDKGRQEVNVKIISYAGIIATNTIKEYGLETINNEGTSKARLELGTEGKTATVSAQVVNNYDTEITGVNIIGTFPTEKALIENNINVGVNNLQVNGIDNSRVKVYYTENAKATADANSPTNNWKDSITNAEAVKKYLIVVDKLDTSEEIDFEYTMNIPANLEYNKTLAEEYEVIYNTQTLKEQSMKAQKLTLETGIGPEITTTLESYVGNEKTGVVKEGEKIEYVITVKNTGTVAVENIQLKGQVPEGTTYMEEIPIVGEPGESQDSRQERFFEDENKKEVVIDKINLQPGEQISKAYLIKVEKGLAGKTLQNTIEAKYAEITKNSNTIETKVEKGEVEIDMSKGVFTFDQMESGRIGRYIITVTNIADKDLKNVTLKMNVENGTVIDIIYRKDDGELELLQNVDSITIPELKMDGTKEIDISVEMNYFKEPGTKQVVIQPVATVDKEEFRGNRQIVLVDPLLVKMSNTSERDSQYVKTGEYITYKINVTNVGTTAISEMLLRDRISPEESISSVKVNDKELTNEEYSTSNSLETIGTYVNITEEIQAGETKTYTITTQVDPALDNSEAVSIDNTADIYAENAQLATAMVTHIIEPSDAVIEGDIPIGDTNPNDPNNPSNPSNPNDPNNSGVNNGQAGNGTQTGPTKLISGYAWLDKNEDGKRDNDETLLDGIKVKLFNTQTNEFQKNAQGNLIETTTSATGMYTLSEVPQGSYIVVFEFNNSKYALTTYEKAGVSSETNSKVVSKEMTIDGVQKTVAVSEVITVGDEHISYINMGLKERKVYDMKLEKMITRVIVQNNKGTETTQFQDTTLAKVDIHAKELSSSNVVVDYKIRVTNEGETEGYIKNIVDYVSPDFKFSSELNKDWYQSGSNIYNNSLANTKLQPGESKEVTLTLTKQMTENNTGTITNTAEISSSYNEQGLKDADSVEGNRAQGEDDMSQADLIISIKTGEIIATVGLIITIITVLALGSFVIIKKVMKSVEI